MLAGDAISAPDHPITERAIAFAAHLRLNGFLLGPTETEVALDLIRRAPCDRQRIQLSLKTLLTSRRDEWERFDGLFEAFWLRRGKEHTRWRATSTAETSRRLPPIWQRGAAGDDAKTKANPRLIRVEGESDVEGQVSGGLKASDQKSIANTDLRHMVDAEEMAAAARLAYRLALALRYRLSRRYRISRKGARLDFRRTIRANLGHGGEPFELRRKAVPERPVRIVVFLDVSGSMQVYSRFFLQFVKGLVCRWIDADAYLMHTRLIRVTDALRDKNSMKAMARLSLLAEGFGGGTKLGDCLASFNDRYAKKALNSRSVVIILSDGYDTGPPEDLAQELKRLKRRARRLVWLNPLLGWKDYEPVTAAMAAALPYIDHFAAANSLEALAAIEPDLARL
jgi:uncharacterized protein with von Willebrand factor type A (vWA) domain